MQRHSDDLGHLRNCWWELSSARAYEIKEKAEVGQARGRVHDSLGSIGFIT